MIQFATTIEQSKRLLSLGIDPETADMSIRIIVEPRKAEDVAWHTPMLLTMPCSDAKDIYKDDEVTPAWSLSALIALLPDGIKIANRHGGVSSVPLKIEKDYGCWWVGHGSNIGDGADNLFAACINYLNQLIWQGCIRINK